MALTNLTKPRARWATFKLKLAGAISRSLYDKLTESGLSVKDFGAKGDGLTDDTDAFNAAMLFNRIVVVPEGIHMVTGLTLKPRVKLIGAMSQDGWSRSGNYTQGSVIKLIDNSNVPVITLPSSTPDSGAHNLTIDGNKDNQTSYMSHGIRTHFGVTRSTGQTWKGLRVVNCKGFGGYFEGGTVQVTDSFFMSGAFFNRCGDLKIAGCDFDGTDGFHPSLWVNESNSSIMSDSFVWGWGEVAGANQTTKTVSVTINTATNNLDGSAPWMQQDQPVVLFGATSYPEGGSTDYKRFTTWFLQEEGSEWSLWSRPSDNENRQKCEFTTAGSDVILGWGHEETCLITNSFGLGVTNMRFAGTQGEALRLQNVKSSTFNSVRTWGLNYRDLANQAAVRVMDSSLNTFSGCLLGERVGFAPKIQHSVQFIENDDKCERNVIGDDCILQHVIGGVLVRDDTTTNTYLTRNQIHASIQPDAGTKRVEGQHYYLEPEHQMFSGRQTTTSLPANTNTNSILHTYKKAGISTPNTTSLSMVTTEGGLYNIKGQFRIIGADSTITAVKLTVTVGSTPKSFHVYVDGSSLDGHGITVPFNFDYTELGAQGAKTVTYALFCEGGGTGMSLDATDEWSNLSIKKLADIPKE